MMKRYGRKRLVFLVGLLLIASGCATVDRQAAQRLATTGNTFAMTTAQMFAQTDGALDTFMAREYMLSALRPESFSAPSESQEINVRKLSEALRLRAAVLQQLALTYASFNALASYDAATEVQTSLTGLTGAINAYGKTLNPMQPLISGTTDVIISEIGGLIAEQVQAKKIKQASQLLRSKLQTFRALLTQESQLYKDVGEVMMRTATRTTLALYRAGIGSPHPLLKELVGDVGFEYIPDEKQIATLKETERDNLDKGIDIIVQKRISRRVDQESGLIDSTIQAMTDLISEHENLEQGQQLNLATLTAGTARFRAILDRINATRVKHEG